MLRGDFTRDGQQIIGGQTHEPSRPDELKALSEEIGDASAVEALLRSVADEFERDAKVKKNVPEEALTQVAETHEASKLADLVSGHLGIEVDKKQALLETLSIADRIYVLAGGKVVGDGSPDALRTHPSQWVHQFIEGLPDGPVPFHFPAPGLLDDLMDGAA